MKRKPGSFSLQQRAEYLTDGEHGVVGFSHGVVNEDGHEFSDLVQISSPAFLRGQARCTMMQIIAGSLRY